MSDFQGSAERRGDARRNLAGILDAAVELLGRGGDPSMVEVARAAGVTRQTVYAHFPSRSALFTAVLDHLTRATVETLADVDPREGTALEALDRWLLAAWKVVDRYPALLNPALVAAATGTEDHGPVVASLRPIPSRGRRSGEITRDLDVDWLVAAVVALAHLAGEQVATGQLGPIAAAGRFRTSALRLCADLHGAR